MKTPFKSTKLRVTSPYGERTLEGKTAFHSGYDLVPVSGSWDILAVSGGKVVRSRIITDKSNPTWQWGNYVGIKTDDGRLHYYCHMASRAVSEGQTVRAGDKLGVMGNTGYSLGSHLHFEVRGSDGKTPVCPEEVLGVPNKAGIYEIKSDGAAELENDLETLVKNGVINTPNYWKKTAPTVKYLPELIHNMALALGKK